jgi:hypothetical protein
MEPFDQKLSAELSALRPAPRPEFAAELDQRAAAGFPRPAGAPGPLQGLLDWLRALSPRQLVLPATGTALAALAIATVVVSMQEPATDSSSLARLNAGEEPAPSLERGFSESQQPPAVERHGGGESSGVQYGAAIPGVASAPSASDASSAGSTSSGTESEAASSQPSGPYAADTGRRKVERSAEITLGADPERVAEDAAKVFDAVHAVDGIVLRSSVSGGPAGEAGAEFELLIPSARLGDALASFSAIDAVLDRHEATDDITAPTVRTGEQLRDSRAKIDGLLIQLAEASTEAERVAAETELRAERRHNANLRSQLSTLERRSNLSRVSLRIETGVGVSSGGSDEGWGIGAALDDAGQVLSTAAAVAVVGLAILAPFALIALLAWLANRARLRRARERALA